MTTPLRSFTLKSLLKKENISDPNFLRIGPGDYISSKNSTDFFVFPRNTIEIRFELPEELTGNVTLYKVENTQGFYKIWVSSSNALNIDVGSDGNTIISENLQANTRYLISVVFQQLPIIDLYINGTFTSTATLLLGNRPPYFGDAPKLEIYSDGGTVDLYDLRIWPTILSQQIITNSSKYRNWFAYSPTSSNGVWNFGNALNGIIPDNSPKDLYLTTNAKTNFDLNRYLNKPAWLFDSNTEAYINNSTFPEYVKNKDTAISIEGWVYVNEDSISAPIITTKLANNGDVNNPFTLSLNTSNKAVIAINDREGQSFNLTSTAAIEVNSWNHVGFAYEAGNDNYSFIINGSVENGVFGSTPKLLNLSILSGVVFGNTATQKALFRNWRLYETKLSDSELINAYEYSTEYPVSQQYLLAEWKFQEECTGWAYDCSDHGNYLYPVTGSGLSSSNQILATYTSVSGLYPEMWDGYSYASTATDIYGDHINNVDEPELIFNDNSVLEVLFFNAYDDWTRGLNDPGLADIPTNSFPLGIYYGPYIVTTDSNYTNYIQQYVYHSGLGITTAVFSNYAREIPYTNADILSSRDGKWHHVIAMHSIYETISGTNYNAAIYHNGKLAGVYEYFTHTGLHALNTGKLALGHYLNGSVAIARVYSPTTSGMVDWFNGTNVLFTPGFSVTDCSYASTAENNLLFDANFDYTNQNISNNSNAFDRTYSLRTYSPLGSPGVSISKIPLNHRYFSVADTIPDVPTPKFAITDIEHTGEYSLKCEFRVNTDKLTSVINSDPLSFTTVSGIYILTASPSITLSGQISSDIWNTVTYRFKNITANIILNGKELYSGESLDWYSPQETIKWGFYCNSAIKHTYVDVKKISAYDKWISDIECLSTETDAVCVYELKKDLINSRAGQSFD